MNPMLSPDEQTLCLQTPLLDGGDISLMDRIMSRSDVYIQHFEVGQVLYNPHNFQRCLAILLAGQVCVTNDSLVISVLEPGTLFGAAALYSHTLDYATTITARSSGKAFCLAQAAVDHLLATEPLVRQNYLCYLSDRIRFLSDRLKSVTQSGSEGKLARYLLTNGRGGMIRLSATELAKQLGISRASLYRAFETLETAGLIQRSGKTTYVLDLAALESAF